MTIMSMTAYSRLSQKGVWGELVWELRSINHRFLDVFVKLPDEMGELEMKVRESLRARLGRGKISASLNYIPGEDAPYRMNVNPAILKQLISVVNDIQPHFAVQADFVHLLKWPGLLTVTTSQRDDLITALYDLLDLSIAELILSRTREGEQLERFIEMRLKNIDELILKVESKLPEIEAAIRIRLQQRINDLPTIIDPQRFQQEVLFYLQKTDVAEEIKRLQTHVIEMRRALKNEDVVGRRLDFLIQEMLREVNTMGNKINDIHIQQICVELKVLIEQIREQVQNIE